MERLSYDEVREWFWKRTWFWLVVAAVASAAALYGVLAYMVSPLPIRSGLAWAAGAGIPAVLCGLFAARVSLQWPWTRLGWRYGFLLNGPACAALAGATALVAALIAASVIQNNPPNQFEQPKEYGAYAAMLNVALLALKAGVGFSVFWGFVFGNWFTLRRDRYFVEEI